MLIHDFDELRDERVKTEARIKAFAKWTDFPESRAGAVHRP
jgi:hypothetical protein